MLGRRVVFDAETPDMLRLIFVADVLTELVKNTGRSGKVSLNELLYD